MDFWTRTWTWIVTMIFCTAGFLDRSMLSFKRFISLESRGIAYKERDVYRPDVISGLVCA